jgi:hypothetical protein
MWTDINMWTGINKSPLAPSTHMAQHQELTQLNFVPQNKSHVFCVNVFIFGFACLIKHRTTLPLVPSVKVENPYMSDRERNSPRYIESKNVHVGDNKCPSLVLVLS